MSQKLPNPPPPEGARPSSTPSPSHGDAMLDSLIDCRALLAALVMRCGGEAAITQAELDMVAGYNLSENGEAGECVAIKLIRARSN